MKTITTRLLKIIALIIPIALFVSFMQSYIFCYLDQSTERIRRFYLEEENSLDVVFMGASEVPTAFAPGLAYEEFGFTSYMYTIDANPGSLYKYQLKEILSTQNPQAIVVEINGFLYGDDYQADETRLRIFAENIPFSMNKLQAVFDFDPVDKLSYLFPFTKYHGDWIKGKGLTETYNWKTKMAQGPSMWKGITTCTLVAPLDPAVLQATAPADSDKIIIAMDCLIDFLEFCKEENISNIIFARLAHRNSASHANSVAQVEQVLAEYGYPLLNLEEKIDEIGLDFHRDFYNDEHLNIYGMEKSTAYLGSYLANEVLGAPVAQSQKNAAHWDECTDAYEVFRAYAYDRTEKGIEAWPGEEPYEVAQIQAWLEEN